MATIDESDIEPSLLEALRALAASENKSLDEVANRVIKDGSTDSTPNCWSE